MPPSCALPPSHHAARPAHLLHSLAPSKSLLCFRSIHCCIHPSLYSPVALMLRRSTCLLLWLSPSPVWHSSPGGEYVECSRIAPSPVRSLSKSPTCFGNLCRNISNLLPPFACFAACTWAVSPPCSIGAPTWRLSTSPHTAAGPLPASAASTKASPASASTRSGKTQFLPFNLQSDPCHGGY